MDGEIEEKLLDSILDELHLLLQLLEMELKLDLSKLLEQQGLTFEDDGELHDELFDGELLDGKLEE